jgi:hypothetical protein
MMITRHKTVLLVSCIITIHAAWGHCGDCVTGELGRHNSKTFRSFMFACKVCNIPVYLTATFLGALTGNMNAVMLNVADNLTARQQSA